MRKYSFSFLSRGAKRNGKYRGVSKANTKWVQGSFLGLIPFILNIPFTCIGLVLALISVPVEIKFKTNPISFILKIKSFWWSFGNTKNARAKTIGHVVLLGQNLEDKDLEHELIHVEQYQRMPLIFPVLYYIERIKKGYRNNKYEEEAYRRAGNIYKI